MNKILRAFDIDNSEFLGSTKDSEKLANEIKTLLEQNYCAIVDLSQIKLITSPVIAEVYWKLAQKYSRDYLTQNIQWINYEEINDLIESCIDCVYQGIERDRQNNERDQEILTQRQLDPKTWLDDEELSSLEKLQKIHCRHDPQLQNLFLSAIEMAKDARKLLERDINQENYNKENEPLYFENRFLRDILLKYGLKNQNNIPDNLTSHKSSDKI